MLHGAWEGAGAAKLSAGAPRRAVHEFARVGQDETVILIHPRFNYQTYPDIKVLKHVAGHNWALN